MYISENIDETSMTFAQALFISETKGVSIVPTYYSFSAKESVQFYINKEDGRFYSQDTDQKAKVTNISQERLKQHWEVYTGSYPQYHVTLAYKKRRFKEISEELGINFKRLTEFLKLAKELQNSNELNNIESIDTKALLNSIREFDY